MTWWFEKAPERLEFELRKLEDAGFSYSITDDGKGSGLLKLRIEYRDWEDDQEPGRLHYLTATFPPSYPASPFEILASTFPPGVHINPESGLCLLQDPGNNWDGSRDFLAAFLLCQVKDILRAHHGDETVFEAQEGLRQTGYIRYQPGSAMLIGDWDVPPEIDRGYFCWRRFPADPLNRFVRGAVTHLKTANNKTIGELAMGKFWTDWLQNGAELSGRWVRLPAIPKGSDPLEEARAVWPDIANMIGSPDLIGLLIPEEKEKGGELIDNWVFVLRVSAQHEQTNQQGTVLFLVRAEQFSEETKWSRAPRAIPIGAKKALVVGLGAIGAPLAWQLARAGIGDLRCVDYDSVQIGNVPRWLYGMAMIGDSKASCVAANLQQHYPPLRAEAIEYCVGAVDASPATYGRFMAALDEVDIVVDGTAEVSVNRHLEELARERGIPYVWAYGSNGGWGGVVGRSVPGRTSGCYECFQYRMLDAVNALAGGRPVPERAIEPPPAEDLPDVQPVGCFHPTFRGTGFDMDQVSQMAARLVVATLCLDAPPESDSYPNFPWDVAVLSQWDPETGLPTVPNWTTYSLERHPDCQHHDD